MTAQIKDPFIWNNEKWEFCGATDIYDLFDPETFGLHPTMHSTACYKGFVITFRVKNQLLTIDQLEVYCEDGNYPPINDVEPEALSNYGMHSYHSLNIECKHYSGTITIGRDINEFGLHSAYTRPYLYETTRELVFVEGMLVKERDTSGQYSMFD